MVKERRTRIYNVLADDAFSLTSDLIGGITVDVGGGRTTEILADRYEINMLDIKDPGERLDREVQKLLTGQKSCFGIKQINFKPDWVVLEVENLALKRLFKELHELRCEFGPGWSEGCEFIKEIDDSQDEAALVYIYAGKSIEPVRLKVATMNPDGTADHYEIRVSASVYLTEYAATTAAQRADPSFDPYSYVRQISEGYFAWMNELNGASADKQRYMRFEVNFERHAPLL